MEVVVPMNIYARLKDLKQNFIFFFTNYSLRSESQIFI